MVNGRPPRRTSAEPYSTISACFSVKCSMTFAGSKGAPIVTMAFADLIWSATAKTAAPPRLWPIRRLGGKPRSVMAWVAARKSNILVEKLVFENSPPECPRPVKSKRNTAMPCAASLWAIRFAAGISFEQVKQCANKALARCGPSGKSNRAASWWPSWFANVNFSTTM